MVHRLGDLAERLGVRVSVAGDNGDDPLHGTVTLRGREASGRLLPEIRLGRLDLRRLGIRPLLNASSSV